LREITGDAGADEIPAGGGADAYAYPRSAGGSVAGGVPQLGGVSAYSYSYSSAGRGGGGEDLDTGGRDWFEAFEEESFVAPSFGEDGADVEP